MKLLNGFKKTDNALYGLLSANRAFCKDFCRVTVWYVSVMTYACVFYPGVFQVASFSAKDQPSEGQVLCLDFSVVGVDNLPCLTVALAKPNSVPILKQEVRQSTSGSVHSLPVTDKPNNKSADNSAHDSRRNIGNDAHDIWFLPVNSDWYGPLTPR